MRVRLLTFLIFKIKQYVDLEVLLGFLGFLLMTACVTGIVIFKFLYLQPGGTRALPEVRARVASVVHEEGAHQLWSSRGANGVRYIFRAHQRYGIARDQIVCLRNTGQSTWTLMTPDAAPKATRRPCEGLLAPPDFAAAGDLG